MKQEASQMTSPDITSEKEMS